MLQEDLHPTDDHSHKFFIWPEWIAAHGPLSDSQLAFDYFTTSMFYDKQSNNQVLRMQTQHTGLPLVNETEELRRFVGTEFALVHAVPPSLFIIHKRQRLSPDEVRPLAAYFIVNNRIYESPTVYSVLSNRLLTTVHALQSSLETLRQHRPDYEPRTGFVWPIVENEVQSTNDAEKLNGQSPPGSPADKSPAAQEMGDAAFDINEPVTDIGDPTPQSAKGNTRKRENYSLMYHAMRTTAAHMQTSFLKNRFAEEDAAAAAATLGMGNGEVADSRSQSSAMPLSINTGTPVTSAPTPAGNDQIMTPRGTNPVVKKKRKKGLPQTPA